MVGGRHCCRPPGARSVTKCACFGSGSLEGLAVVVVVRVYWFAPIRSVASPAVHVDCSSRRIQCSPISKAQRAGLAGRFPECLLVLAGKPGSVVLGSDYLRTLRRARHADARPCWWSWAESNRRPKRFLSASYSHIPLPTDMVPAAFCKALRQPQRPRPG